MTNKPAILVALVGLLFAGAAVARARVAYEQAGDGADPATGYEPYQPEPSYTDQVQQLWADLTTETESNTMPYIPSTPDRQLAAFREAIIKCEGTDRGDPARVCYGYRHTVRDLSDHPAVTGEWKGEVLPDGMCAAAGYGPGCVSTAAGAYQFIKPTWVSLKRKLGLPDFSRASQDRACDELLKQCGAYSKILSGDIAGAVVSARKIWASLPGAGYGQGERSMTWVLAKFTDAGGVVA